MRITAPILICLSCTGGIAWAQKSLDQRGFEDYAAKIDVFLADNFFYDRTVSAPGCEEQCQAAVAFQSEIKAHLPDAALLVTLLKHPNPKVRTLAMAALLDREERLYLRDISGLATDPAVTFRTILPTANIPKPLPTRDQTVGEIARVFASLNTEPLWLRDGPTDSPAAWIFFRMKRAVQGQSPVDPARIPKIQALRHEVEALPQPERAWMFLLLRGAPLPENDEGPTTLIRTTELVADLKTVRHDDLLKLLRKDMISDDPVLQSQPNNNYLYHSMCLFVLENARELLRPDDAAFLLERERWERNHRQLGIVDPLISAWWAIAAAELDSENAGTILKAAWSRFGEKYQAVDRGLLAQALWREAGGMETRQVVDWFYDDAALGRDAFWRQLSKRPAPDDVKLVRRLIADPRLDRLGWRDLEAVVKAANQFTKMPLVTWEEFRDTSFVTMDFSYANLEESRRKYPEQTNAIVERLQQWRERLRAAFPTR